MQQQRTGYVFHRTLVIHVSKPSNMYKNNYFICKHVKLCIHVIFRFYNSTVMTLVLDIFHDQICAGSLLLIGNFMEIIFCGQYRPRKALNIIRITPRSSALYNAILYGKIVLAQYRTQGFSTLMRVVGIFRHKQRLCALLCSFMQCSISKIRQ